MVFGFLDFTRDNILALFGLGSYSSLFIFELIDMIIMAFAIGYIFSSFLRKPVEENYDPLVSHRKKTYDWEQLKYAALAAGPAVILHELAHKFTAMAFGAKAILYAPYGFYLFVIILKMIGFPFLFFVGGFVAISGVLTPLQGSLIAFAGPFTNFLIWAAAVLIMKHKLVNRRYYIYLIPLAQISLFLAIFNLIPIPGFDGYDFFSNLFKWIF
jgi:Zn-dependent protease